MWDGQDGIEFPAEGHSAALGVREWVVAVRVGQDV
jgi:hypothetical protein